MLNWIKKHLHKRENGTTPITIVAIAFVIVVVYLMVQLMTPVSSTPMSVIGATIFLKNHGYVVATAEEITDLQDSIRYNQDTVYFDAESSYNGTAYPIGTRGMPVNNGPDLRAILAARGLKKVILLSDFSLDADMTNLIWDSEQRWNHLYDGAVIPPPMFENMEGGLSIDGCLFKNLALYSIGNPIVDVIRAEDCTLNIGWAWPGSKGADKAYLSRCSGWALVTTKLVADDCTLGEVRAAEVTISRNHNGTAAVFTIFGLSAGISRIEYSGGPMSLMASCVGGTLDLYGDCQLVDNSDGLVVNDYRLVTLLAP
jgi:hypothetical protein